MSMTRVLLSCALVLALVAPVYADRLIPDGSFEDSTGGVLWVSSVAGWTAAPSATAGMERLGLFFVFDGLTATQGSSFAALTNYGGGGQTLTSSTFTIDRTDLRFQYVYASQNPGDALNPDPFTVTLIAGGTPYVYEITDSSDADLELGDIGPSPFNPVGGTWDTDWRMFSIDTESLIGQSATIMFSLADTGSGGGVSGIFLDNVYQIPEPGTLVLFGAGFLGLAIFGRRKFGKKK